MSLDHTARSRNGSKAKPGRTIASHMLSLTAAVVVFTAWSDSVAQAPPVVSQYLAAMTPILDENGEKLRGTSPASPSYGIEYVEGDVIEFYIATDGNIYPPDANGNPHANNQFIDSTRIGLGVSPVLPHSGLFGGTIPRPSHGTLIFARAFNAPSVAGATYYGDSQLYRVVHTRNETFLVNIQQTDQLLDPGGTGDPVDPDDVIMDTDDDGLTDKEEEASGTNKYDPASYLSVTSIMPIEALNGVLLVWESVPGKRYMVEYAEAGAGSQYNVVSVISPLDNHAYLAEVTAQAASTFVLVPGALSWGHVRYRICVIQ